MSNEKNVNCQFMVMTDTGEQPDAVIHMAAFEQEDGVAIRGKQKGGGKCLIMMVSSLVEDLIRQLNEKDGVLAAAAFIAKLGDAMTKAGGKEAMMLATLLSSPKDVASLMKKALGDMNIGEMEADDLAKMLGIKLEDEEDE